ncbi:LysR family transcriptional regulator [Kitasatospora sp. NPDC008050]|uniref:LysR family transcriptional regulator n=1 Tax=Kitasatospora sp. NPDC008050 TaxID=3364021 RepID=UPI0036F0C51E
MDMLHLRYFVAVAEELNFTRAAARLHMATSPLSQRIKDLERELTTPLFVRTHHKVELTPAGEALLPAARDVIRQFEAIPGLVHTAARAHPRTAVIGIAPDVSTELRTRFLGTLAGRHPDLPVRLHPASTEPLVRSLLSGEIDMGFLHGPVTGPGIRTLDLETVPVAVVVGRGTGFDERTAVRLEELAHLPFASIGYDAAPEIYHRLDEVLNRVAVRKRIGLEGHNFAGLAHLVAAGQAFTLIALGSGTTGKAFTGEPVVTLGIEGSDLTLTTVAAWHQDRPEPGQMLAGLAATLTKGLPSPKAYPPPTPPPVPRTVPRDLTSTMLEVSGRWSWRRPR